MPEFETVTDPQPGDLAFHVNGYDPRPVTRVEAPWFIWLRVGADDNVGPCEIENYTFRRPTKEN